MIRHLPTSWAAVPIGLLLAMTAADAAPAPRGCGSVVVLVGDQGDWRAPPLKCADGRRVTYNARRATFRTIRIAGVTGITIRGGTVGAAGIDGPAVTVDGSRFVHLTEMTFTGAKLGVTLVRGTDYLVDHSRFTGLRSDGVNINQAQRVTIDGNTFSDSHPIPQVYDAQGKLVRDGDHADAIQAFSLAGQVPLRDLVFTNNRISGHMQGIDNFGDASGTTNVRVEGNVIDVDYWHGITFSGVTNLIVRNNIVKTIPGARQGPRGQQVRTWVKVDRNTNVVACGNTVPEFPKGPGTQACR